jgi:hypothetical protein
LIYLLLQSATFSFIRDGLEELEEKVSMVSKVSRSVESIDEKEPIL